MTADPAELLAARTLMAFTLGSHIILVPLGVAFPALVLIANFIGLKRKDLVALGGVFSIISANGWMNAPAGFTVGSDGRPTNVDPIAAIFNNAVWYEFPHMLAAAYMTAGFLIAGVFAVAHLRGNWGRYQRL